MDRDQSGITNHPRAQRDPHTAPPRTAPDRHRPRHTNRRRNHRHRHHLERSVTQPHQVRITPNTGITGPPIRATVHEDGTYKARGVPTGSYLVCFRTYPGEPYSHKCYQHVTPMNRYAVRPVVEPLRIGSPPPTHSKAASPTRLCRGLTLAAQKHPSGRHRRAPSEILCE